MIIKWAHDDPLAIEFEKLDAGVVFKCNDEIFIKVEDNINHMAVATKLSNGQLTTFGNKTKVTKLNAKLLIIE